MGERGVETIEGTLGTDRRDGLQRTRGAERPGVETRVKHGDLRAGLGDAIAMAVRYPFDKAVQPESPEVVRHRACRIGRRTAALELRDVIAKLPVMKAGRGESKETERVHEGMHARVAKPEPGGPLIVDDDG